MINLKNAGSLVVCILILLSFNMKADPAIDSLKAELLLHNGDLKKQAFYLNRIAYHYRKISTDSTVFYALAAKKLADKLNLPVEKAMVYNNLALADWINGNFETALQYNLKALKIREEYKDTTGMIQTYLNLGLLYGDMKNHKESFKYYQKALEYGQSSIHLLDLNKKKRYFEQAFKIYTTNTTDLDNSFIENLSDITIEKKALEKEKKNQQKLLFNQSILLNEKEYRYARLIDFVIISIIILLITAVFVYLRIKIRRRKLLLKEQKISKELELKNRELSSYTLNFVRKKELFEDLKDQIERLNKKHDNAYTELKNISDIIREGENLDKDWEDFKIYFEQVHTDFFNSLKKSYPELTGGDLKLCALLKMNLNLKEAATVLGISPNSVKTARYRLRKKLDLEQEKNLTDFILSFESEEYIKNYNNTKSSNGINFQLNNFF